MGDGHQFLARLALFDVSLHFPPNYKTESYKSQIQRYWANSRWISVVPNSVEWDCSKKVEEC